MSNKRGYLFLGRILKPSHISTWEGFFRGRKLTDKDKHERSKNSKGWWRSLRQESLRPGLKYCQLHWSLPARFSNFVLQECHIFIVLRKLLNFQFSIDDVWKKTIQRKNILDFKHNSTSAPGSIALMILMNSEWCPNLTRIKRQRIIWNFLKSRS